MGSKAYSTITFNPVLDVQPVTNVNITLPSNTVAEEKEPPLPPSVPLSSVENLFSSFAQALTPPPSPVQVSDPMPTAQGSKGPATGGFSPVLLIIGGLAVVYFLRK